MEVAEKRETFLTRHSDIIALIVSILAMFLWSVSLSRADFLWSRAESKADSRRIEDLVTAMQAGIRAEMQDFHGRLCSIEERTREVK
jgi:hypothetical protein